MPILALFAALLLPMASPLHSGQASSVAVHAALPNDMSSAFPESARVKVAFNLPLDLHNFLLVATQDDLPPAMAARVVGYAEQITAYKEARGMIVDPLAWRFINDSILEGPDMATISSRAAVAPGSLGAMDAVGVQKILTALGAAWPRFEKEDLDEHRISLQKMRLRMEKQAALFEPRVMPVIYEKLGLTYADAPVTVYTVIESLESGVMGKTSAGYYLVIPTKQRAELVILETMFHELTHLLDSIQPADKKSILRQVRAGAKGSPTALVEEMLHGLVTYNSGVVLQRFGKPDYTPMVNASAAMGDRIARFRSVFDGSWSDYLNGKIGADEVVKALVSSVQTAAKTGTSSS